MDGIVAQLRAVIGLDVSDFKRGASEVKSQIQEIKAQAQTLGTVLTAAFTAPALAAAKVGAEFVQMKQSATIAFEVLLKSGAKAKALFSDLSAFAAKTPFDLPDVVKGTQRLTAMGYTVKDSIQLLRVLGDAVAGVGGNSDMLGRVSVVLGQIKNAGTLKTQDLNQLVDFPVLDILAKKLHKSTAQIKADMEKGAIDSKTAIEAIMQGFDEKYGGTMEKMGNTWATTVSNLKDNAQQALGALFEPGINSATKFVQGITEKLGGLRDYFSSLSEDTRKKIVAVIGVLAGIGPAILLVNGIGMAFAALATPVGIAVAAAAAFAIAYTTNFGHTRDVTNQVIGAIGQAINKLGPWVLLAGQMAVEGWKIWIQAARDAATNAIETYNVISGAFQSVGKFIVDTFKNTYENVRQAVSVVGQTFSILFQYFRSAGGVAGTLGTIFGNVWDKISSMTATGVQAVVGLVGSMLSKLGEMTGATNLVQTINATAMALQNGVNIILNANRQKIADFMGGISAAVNNFKLPGAFNKLDTKFADQGESAADKKKRDKEETEAERHAKRLAAIQAELNKAIYDATHSAADRERYEMWQKVAEYRKAGAAKKDIDKFIVVESKRIHDDAQKKINEATAEADKKRIAAATEAARNIAATIDNLFESHLLSFKGAESEILAAMHLVSVGAKEEEEIFRSGDEGQIALLKKLNDVRGKMHDEEIKRIKAEADFRKKYNLTYVGGLGIVPVLKNLKPKETDAEKYTAAATKSLSAALQDAQAGFSKANSHASRFSEVLARLNLDYSKLNDAQRKTLSEIVQWDEATARLEKYKRRLEEIKGEAKSILSSAFEGALDGSAKFFDSIRQSFKKMIVHMAAEWAASQVVKAALGAFGLGGYGLGKDSEKARNNMITGAAAITAAAAALTTASATLAASASASAGFGAAGMAGAGTGLSTAAGAAGAAKGGGLLGAGLGRTLGYVGIGLAADQLLFKGAISKGIGKTVGKVTKLLGFAEGGQPPLDRPSVVGEDGPELFWPKGAGTVHSNKDSRSLISGMGSGGGVNFNGPVHISSQADVDRIQSVRRAKAEQSARLL